MPIMTVGTGRALIGGGGNYNDLVMGTGPIAYWPQSESSGLTAYCLTNPAMNGTYTAVTLANDNTGPFGTPAPFYDGATSFCNIYSAAFNAAFNGATGTSMSWFKVFNVGVWTDAARRDALMIFDDGNDFTYLSKTVVANRVTFLFNAGAGAAVISKNGVVDTAWICAAQTWSDSNNDDEYKAFWNGVQEGVTSAALNAWAGAGLDNTATCIGANSTVPGAPFHGWLGPYAVWDRVLTPGEILALAA